jgi:hypothetical protein
MKLDQNLKRFLNSFLVICLLSSLHSHPAIAKSSSDSEKALALAFSGCTFGMLKEIAPKVKIQGLDLQANEIKGHLEMAVTYRLIDEGLLSEKISRPYNNVGRVGYENVIQSFSMASLLSSRWKMLDSSLNGLISETISQFRNGQTLGVARDRAFAKFGQRAVAACKLAIQLVKSKSKSKGITEKQWVLKTARGLLPPLHSAADDID